MPNLVMFSCFINLMFSLIVYFINLMFIFVMNLLLFFAGLNSLVIVSFWRSAISKEVVSFHNNDTVFLRLMLAVLTNHPLMGLKRSVYTQMALDIRQSRRFFRFFFFTCFFGDEC